MEYIDRQKIVCAVVLEVKNQRLRLLNENNREMNISTGRLTHFGTSRIDISGGRDTLVAGLRETAERRNTLAETVDVRELWEILHEEQAWVDLETMTGLCFPDAPDEDHESAVIRAFFENRLYFKFNQKEFLPYTGKQVERMQAQAREAARREQLIEKGGEWLRQAAQMPEKGMSPRLSDAEQEYAAILQSFYLYEKESPWHDLGRAMVAKAGIEGGEKLFDILVRLQVWEPDENIDLYRMEIPTDFPSEVMQCTESIRKAPAVLPSMNGRRDLTDLDLITIDGQSTLDFDDALSFEDRGDHYLVGVHIADVGHYIEKGTPVDQEAFQRGSSIYMPDQKIPMLPPPLAEGQCSLKAGELRPAISTMIRLDRNGEILGSETFPSMIRVKDQLTYYDVNVVAEEDRTIYTLYQIAQQFRQRRLAAGAIHISLPEINVWLNENDELVVNRTNRESPGRLLVAELMIMANWLMARFLAGHRLPAIFRSQPAPKERLYKENGGSLFQNWMQRKLLSRFVLNPTPEHHAGLGLDAYVTATSPIRKYFDLITQRQIRSVFGLNPPSSTEEVELTIQNLAHPMSCVSRLQYRRKRYWLLKYLEGRIGQREEAIVLTRRRNGYLALIPEYMIECLLPSSSGISLKPEDVIQVTIQHVDARKDMLAVFMG